MLFELARALRPLTSPLTSALHQARRMARPFHFEDGGTVPHEGRVVDQNDDGDFVLPSDVREEEVLTEIQDRFYAKRFSMPKRSDNPAFLLKTTVGGRLFVPAAVVLLLGDGAGDRGKRVLEKVVNEIRHRRVLSRLPATSAGHKATAVRRVGSS